MARWGIYGSKGASNVQGVVYLNAAASSMRRASLRSPVRAADAAIKVESIGMPMNVSTLSR